MKQPTLKEENVRYDTFHREKYIYLPLKDIPLSLSLNSKEYFVIRKDLSFLKSLYSWSHIISQVLFLLVQFVI